MIRRDGGLLLAIPTLPYPLTPSCTLPLAPRGAVVCFRERQERSKYQGWVTHGVEVSALSQEGTGRSFISGLLCSERARGLEIGLRG